MFTKTEKGYLIMTLVFLAAGSGIKAYRHAAVKLGPFSETHETHEKNETLATQVASNGPDSVSSASISVLDGGLGLPSADASQSDGTGGRDTVSDSSNGSADPFPLGLASAKASESHRTAQLSTSRLTSKTKTKSAPKTAFNGKVDLNRAEAPELTRVPGIGAKTAQAIVDHRRTHGPYRDFRDLLQIKGIGEKKLEKLIPNLIL